MRKKLVVAVGLAAIAVMALWLWSRSVVEDVGGGKKEMIAVAAEDINPGERITKAQIAYQATPELYVHPEAVKAGEEVQIMNRPVSEKITKGQPFLWSNFDLGKTMGGRKLASVIQKGERALTIPVDLSGSMAGMLRPGDHVDVLGTFARNQGQDYATVTLLQNVVVLATGDTRGDSAEAEAGPAGTGHQFTSITVSVDLEEAELLVFAMQRGPINIALRSTEDLETEEQVPEKNFGDIFEPPKRAAFSHRHAQIIKALKSNSGGE